MRVLTLKGAAWMVVGLANVRCSFSRFSELRRPAVAATDVLESLSWLGVDARLNWRRAVSIVFLFHDQSRFLA